MDDQAASDPLKPKYKRVVLKLSGEGFGAPRQERHQHRRDAQHRPPGQAGPWPRRAARPSSSAAATSSAAPSSPPAARSSRRPPPTTWACSPPSSTAWPCKTPWKASTCETRLQTAIRMESVAEPYIRRRCHAPPGEGPHRHPGRRHRQPVRHHRHRRRPAGPRAGGRHPAQGDQGGRRLQRGPGDQPARGALREADLRPGAAR